MYQDTPRARHNLTPRVTLSERAPANPVNFRFLLQPGLGQGPVEGEIENLLDWLELFHSESLVELDYGGLAAYLDTSLRAQGKDGLDDDTSIEDVAHSLSGLAAADGSIAGQGY